MAGNREGGVVEAGGIIITLPEEEEEEGDLIEGEGVVVVEVRHLHDIVTAYLHFFSDIQIILQYLRGWRR